MEKAQEPGTWARQLARSVAAAVAALALVALAVATGVAQHEEPAARFVVAECQGFNALASVGGVRASCTAPLPCQLGDESGPSGSTGARCGA